MSDLFNREDGPNPSGLCMCGCGEKTQLAPKSYTDRGWVRGQPVQYLCGHNNTKSPVQYTVNPLTQCWEWQRVKNSEGYGQLYVDGVKVYAHRYFYEQKYGLLPEGYEVDHLCRNRACANPEHMETVTHAENTQRGSCAKLTPEDILTIRAAVERGAAQKAVASQFNIHSSHVSRIISGQYWGNVGRDIE